MSATRKYQSLYDQHFHLTDHQLHSLIKNQSSPPNSLQTAPLFHFSDQPNKRFESNHLLTTPKQRGRSISSIKQGLGSELFLQLDRVSLAMTKLQSQILSTQIAPDYSMINEEGLKQQFRKEFSLDRQLQEIRTKKEELRFESEVKSRKINTLIDRIMGIQQQQTQTRRSRPRLQ